MGGPDRMSEDLPDRMAEDLPDRMSEGMPGRMSEDMPDRMPEDMPERIAEDLHLASTFDNKADQAHSNQKVSVALAALSANTFHFLPKHEDLLVK